VLLGFEKDSRHIICYINGTQGFCCDKAWVWPRHSGHACNPNIFEESRGGRIVLAQEFDTNLGNLAKSHLYRKYKKSARHWWRRL
jgi:hypothetical protein